MRTRDLRGPTRPMQAYGDTDMNNASQAIWTIGHSTRTLAELIALLTENRIELLADVRRFPASRRHPQFNRATLEASLRPAGIDYVWLEALGGRRSARKDSHNTAWRNSGFRGYADYMETPLFEAAIAELARDMRQRRTAVMCAEQAWQQCHRGLIADYLKAHAFCVTHILGPQRTQVHPWTAAAQIVDGRLSYRAAPDAEQSGFDF
jgi:uncharacterized protein (DUF488 family)